MILWEQKTMLNHCAVLDAYNIIAATLNQLRIVGHDQNSLLAFQRGQQRRRLLHVPKIQAAGGLIKD